MRTRKAAVLAAIIVALASGSALAASTYPQTAAQIHADLENPHNITFVPFWK